MLSNVQMASYSRASATLSNITALPAIDSAQQFGRPTARAAHRGNHHVGVEHQPHPRILSHRGRYHTFNGAGPARSGSKAKTEKRRPECSSWSMSGIADSRRREECLDLNEFALFVGAANW